jgi:hypothetical protein
MDVPLTRARASAFPHVAQGGAVRLSFTARIEGAHSDRAASTSKKDGLAVPPLTLPRPRVVRAKETNGLPSPPYPTLEKYEWDVSYTLAFGCFRQKREYLLASSLALSANKTNERASSEQGPSANHPIHKPCLKRKNDKRVSRNLPLR